MKTPEAVYQAAFEGVGRLVPHEFAQLVLLGDAAPDAFGRTYGLRKLESRDIPSPYRENYPYYFKRTDMRITAIPYRPALFAASYAQFAGMEFGEEWCRPLKARWSAASAASTRAGASRLSLSSTAKASRRLSRRPSSTSSRRCNRTYATWLGRPRARTRKRASTIGKRSGGD